MLLINTPKSFCYKAGNMHFVTMNDYAIGILKGHRLFRTKCFSETQDNLMNVTEVSREEIMLALEKVEHDHDHTSKILETIVKLNID